MADEMSPRIVERMREAISPRREGSYSSPSIESDVSKEIRRSRSRSRSRGRTSDDRARKTIEILSNPQPPGEVVEKGTIESVRGPVAAEPEIVEVAGDPTSWQRDEHPLADSPDLDAHGPQREPAPNNLEEVQVRDPRTGEMVTAFIIPEADKATQEMVDKNRAIEARVHDRLGANEAGEPSDAHDRLVEMRRDAAMRETFKHETERAAIRKEQAIKTGVAQVDQTRSKIEETPAARNDSLGAIQLKMIRDMYEGNFWKDHLNEGLASNNSFVRRNLDDLGSYSNDNAMLFNQPNQLMYNPYVQQAPRRRWRRNWGSWR